MAETEPLPKKPHHPTPNPNPNPTKYFTRFLYKSTFVLIFLVIIPLFPSQAPEFINQSFPTRSWELLHLIFVGITVSYGLFSRRNDEEASDKADAANNNHISMFDHAQSYISRIFHVSPAFDEETDETKGVQTWNSQYTRNENPVVRVGNESEGGKPLLLPVRSLKNRVFEVEDEMEEQPSTVSDSFTRSNSSKKKKEGNDLQEKEKPKDDIVLPSPIPWRSRSGRLEYSKEEQEPRLSRSQTLEPRVLDRVSPQNPLSLEPKKPKIGEDFVKKKSFRKSNPPPPPPPPPLPPRVPPVVGNPRNILSRKEVRRVQSGFEHINPGDDDLPRKEVRRVQSGFEHRNPGDDDLPRKEVRRVQSGFEHRNPSDDDLPRKEVRRVQSGFEQRNPNDDLPRKSVRTVRSGNFNSRVDDESMDFEFVEKPKDEEKYDFFKELVSQSEVDSEEENGGGPDVDKKADEFIAKFREQIRLQRIESIKRSSAEISKKVHR